MTIARRQPEAEPRSWVVSLPALPEAPVGGKAAGLSLLMLASALRHHGPCLLWAKAPVSPCEVGPLPAG